MADARIRIRLNGTAEAGTGTEYTAYLYKVKTTDILNKPSEFDITLLGSTNTSDIATGNVVELYWGTTMSVANRFFKGKIKTVEEQTAKRIRIYGKGAGWANLIDRKHAYRKEWGSTSRTKITIPTVTRSALVSYLRSRDLDGSAPYLVNQGTITSSLSTISFFDTQFENRLNPFIRCAELWNTDLWFDQDGAGDDRVNLTAKGSDKTGSVVFNFSGASKNAKVGSNILDRENQFTQVNVIGAGDGQGQISGKYPASGYIPADPEKEMVVPRPDLKNATDCDTVAQTIWNQVSQPIRRIRFAPDVPGTWLTSVVVGDTVRIGTSNLANLTAPFDTRVHEISFEMDYESGVMELILQTENRLARSFDKQSNTDYIANQSNSTAQFENTMLNLLRDTNTILRVSGWKGGLIAKKAWLTLSGMTPTSSSPVESAYPLILDGQLNDGTAGSDPSFAGHIYFTPGIVADPTTLGVTEGALYYNSAPGMKKFRYYNGTAWADLGSGGSGSSDWTRVTGSPNYLMPTVANDHVLPNGTADLGGAASRWDNLYANNGDFAGNLVLGAGTSNTITAQGRFNSSLVPSADATYTLGIIGRAWGNVISMNGIFSGDVILGSSTSDVITCNGRFDTSLVPSVDATYNLGIIGRAWGSIIGTIGIFNTLQLTSTFTARDILPYANDTYDLGSSSMRWNDIFTNRLNASGNVTLGDSATDTITAAGSFNSDILPLGSGYNLGSSIARWTNIYASALNVAGTFTSRDIIPSSNNSYDLGSSANRWNDIFTTNLTTYGTTTLGDGALDNVVVNGSIASDLLPLGSGHNLGSSIARWTTAYFTNLNISGTFTNSSTVKVTNLNADRVDDRHVEPSATGILAADVNNAMISNLWHIEPQSSSNSATIGSSGYRFNNGYFNVLSKISGTFQIDHPQDPLNKWLFHSFVESPEMVNIYKGRGKLIKGRATIKMPTYFHALNGTDGFEYSLTPIGSPTTLFILKELENGVFEVGGVGRTTGEFAGMPVQSDADCEFSWIVYAVRHDRAALANPVIVEKEKEPECKGRYVLPQLYEDIDPGCSKRQQEEDEGETNG